MGSYLVLGRRMGDIGLMIDFHKARAIVKANTAWIEGISLERIDPGVNDYKPGMVLVHKAWRNLYFLNERERWIDQQYFELAERLMRKLGITKP